MSSSTSRSKLPLILVMGGALAFALGYRIVGMIAVGVGAIMFASGLGGTDPSGS